MSRGACASNGPSLCRIVVFFFLFLELRAFLFSSSYLKATLTLNA